MRFIALFFICLAGMIGSAFAGECDNADHLNRITLELNAEQWVSTPTALTTVSVNAGVNAKALATIQDEILKKLNQFSSGEWHIVSFDRSLDQSGLERVQLQAQARLPASVLPELRNKAKTMSKPGETYSVVDMQFVPSEDELRTANILLRNEIYQQAKDELVRVSKIYNDQHYVIHEVNFVKDLSTQSPSPQNAFIQKMATASGPALAVGNKLVLSALVVLASSPEQCLTKMAR